MGRSKLAIRSFFFSSFLFLCASEVWAQAVGQVVGIEGVAEALQAGGTAWQRLTVPGDVFFHDQLRTQAASKLKVLFHDDSVLTLGENALMTIDEQVVQPAAPGTSIFTILQGMLQAVVSDRYQLPGSRFEVRTPTGVAGVRGTGFIVSCQADSCLFLCLFGRIQVTSPAFPNVPVFLDRQFYTEVRANQPPTSPQVMPEAQVQNLVEQTTVIGTGAQQDRLGGGEGVAQGGVPPEDRPLGGSGGPPTVVQGLGPETGQPTRVDQPLFETGSSRVPILPMDLPPLQPDPLPLQPPPINIPPIYIPPLNILPPTE